MILFPIARHPFSTRDFFFPRSNNDVDREIELRDPAYRFEKKKEREREESEIVETERATRHKQAETIRKNRREFTGVRWRKRGGEINS